MHFIKVQSTDGRVVYVNLANVYKIEPRGNGVWTLHFGSEPIEVAGELEKILGTLR